MIRADAIVLGAGIVGTSVALHLAKRGLAVALVDRRGPGEETSYGNAGVIEGNTIFPHAFPSGLAALARVALKRTSVSNYHFAFLPHIAPWLLSYRKYSSPEHLRETAQAMRPLFARAVAEHESLLVEANATKYLRKTGWIKLYRSDEMFASGAGERELASVMGISYRAMNVEAVRAIEPSLSPVFRHGVHWADAASLSDPFGVTRAYAARFTALGGKVLQGDALTFKRAGGVWQVATAEGDVQAEEAVVTLGPWSPDLLKPLGLSFPLAVKRGYHHHYRPKGNAALERPVVDVENGYCLAPMEQGIRLTTGAEFADRDAPPTPVQFRQLLPAARELFPLGERLEETPWMGRRPCFADSRPIIGRAPNRSDLWLAYGHGHSGMTLGPATGRLIAEMMTGEAPFCDPKPYRAERFA